ncbi:hypothetical protein MTZ49_11255 [Entomomonas sp. E2T0]|uniref:hypothetical protein n=1 Tax=Entomomonas sp. E2T0 TaxID=2930213 RepID=UPI002228340B|nr:hypothetical protein [Entomomonas sp. E2T0]UYZ83175.1 hypothetical protein MTZ49_11255 [Entomomonas sp. E2T0]
MDGKVICTVSEPIPDGLLPNQDDQNTFPMFNNWKPDIEVSESTLKEFIFFWTNKPDIKKTNEQWLQALAQSQQYADSRNEYYRSKGGQDE